MVKTLLIVECQSSVNWYYVFEKVNLLYPDGSEEEIHVEQAEWVDIAVTSYDSGLTVSIRKAKRPIPDTSQTTDRTVQVDFILLRSISHGIVGQDSRNTLYGFMHADIPSINSLESAYMCLEKPVVMGRLRRIEKLLGKKNFPLIPQSYYPSFRSMILSPDLPCVVKIAHTHAGFGKMKVNSREQWDDLRSVVAIHGDYSTSEPFIDWDYDSRVQKIGSHYRLFKRRSPNWKGNTGHSAILEEVEVTPWHKRLADECAKAFGGLDILGLDLVHDEKTDKEWILELNDTAIGLVHSCEQEDMNFMRDLVIERMTKIFGNKKSTEENLPNEPPQEVIERLEKEIELLKIQKERENQESKRQIEQLQEKLQSKETNLLKSWFN